MPVFSDIGPGAQFAMEAYKDVGRQQELQARIGMQLAQMQQRAGEFQQQERRFRDQQEGIAERFRETLNLDKQRAKSRDLHNAVMQRGQAESRQLQAYGMGAEYIPSKTWKTAHDKATEEMGAYLEKTGTGEVDEQEPEVYLRMQELANFISQEPEMELKPREFNEVLPHGKTINSTWNAFDEKESGIGSWEGSGLTDEQLKKIIRKPNLRSGHLSVDTDTNLLELFLEREDKQATTANESLSKGLVAANTYQQSAATSFRLTNTVKDKDTGEVKSAPDEAVAQQAGRIAREEAARVGAFGSEVQQQQLLQDLELTAMPPLLDQGPIDFNVMEGPASETGARVTELEQSVTGEQQDGLLDQVAADVRTSAAEQAEQLGVPGQAAPPPVAKQARQLAAAPPQKPLTRLRKRPIPEGVPIGPNKLPVANTPTERDVLIQQGVLEYGEYYENEDGTVWRADRPGVKAAAREQLNRMQYHGMGI